MISAVSMGSRILPLGSPLQAVWPRSLLCLNGFLSFKISNPADVEDLLQNILIKAYQNIDTLNAQESLKPWLFQIANRTIIDFYRKQANKRELTAEDLWYEQEEPAENELASCIRPFVQALPDKYAQLLTAIELEGISQKAYAEKTGVSYSTLKSRVQKSRAELKKLFDQCCSFQLDGRGNALGCDPRSGCDRENPC